MVAPPVQNLFVCCLVWESFGPAVAIDRESFDLRCIVVCCIFRAFELHRKPTESGDAEREMVLESSLGLNGLDLFSLDRDLAEVLLRGVCQLFGLSRVHYR